MKKELPNNWTVHARHVEVPLETLANQHGELTGELEQFTRKMSEPSIAFNLVRKVRGPEELPEKGFYTGFEGFLVAYCSPEEIAERETQIGEELVRKVGKLPYGLRQEVRDALEGTAFSVRAVQWLDAELGAILARLRATGYNGKDRYNPEKMKANRAFQKETYTRLSVLRSTQREVTSTPDGKGALVEYPLPTRAVDVSSMPSSEAELYVSQIGMFGLPLFRAIANLK